MTNLQLRRYTDLAAAIHLLETKQITLLDPANWNDKNDAHFMAEYKRKIGARTVLALCFAESNETYHHWSVFAHGADGVCLQFDKKQLISSFQDHRDVRCGRVAYRLINTLRNRDRSTLTNYLFSRGAPTKTRGSIG